MEEKRMATTTAAAKDKDTANIHISNEMKSSCVDYISEKSLHETLSLPVWGFPKEFQAIVEEVTNVYQCSRDYVIVSMLSVVATAVGKRIGLVTKYSNFPCLWFSLVGNSGANKSQPMKWAVAPLKAINRELESKNKQAIEQWEQAEKQGEKPQAERVMISDTTPEKRYNLLRRNKNGLLLFRDELRGLFKDFGRYSKSGELELLLQIFDNEDIIIDRETKDSFIAEKPFMNILGSIQPDIIPTIFGNPDLMGDGLNQRFLFVFPDSQPMQEYADNIISQDTTNRWEKFIRKLYYGIGDDGVCVYGSNGFDLQLSQEAKQVYADYVNRTRKRKAGTENSYIGSIYSKNEILVLRLALVVSIISNFSSDFVSEETMKFAVECMENYFTETALKVYDLIRQPERPISIADCIRGLKGKIQNQSIFAESIGVSQPYISNLLNGKK